MRYTNKKGTTLNLDECKTADSFFIEAEVYICEPLEMHFNQQGELKAGKKSNKAIAHLRSDGSELIPAEVQARTHRQGSQLLNLPLVPGYLVDDEGIINNYAIEPGMSLAEYPSPEQQHRYIFQGVIAILLVALTLMTAFTVS